MKDKMDKIKNWLLVNRQLVTIVCFALCALAAILVGIFALKQSAAIVCIVVVLEVLIAALMHNVELWIHAVVLLIQILTGVFIARISLMILCAIMYVVTITALLILYKGKE